MKQISKPSKGNKPATKTNKAAALDKPAAGSAQPEVQDKPAPTEKPAEEKSKAPKVAKAKPAPGSTKLQIITTDFTGKTDWTNKFALAIRGEGEEFLPGWSITHFPTKEARDAEIAALSKGIDLVETRANAPVMLNGKQVFFLRWKGGYRDTKA